MKTNLVDLDNVMTLEQLSGELYRRGLTDRRLSISCLHRWAVYGVAGVKLEHGRLGRRIVTSPEAVVQFTKDVAAAKERQQQTGSPRPGHAEAQRELAAAGEK